MEKHAPALIRGHSLLAVSGGADSVAMGRLFYEAGLSFEMLHVNYGLRGRDSDEDEAFVRMLAAGWGVKCHVIHPDTLAEAGRTGESVQMAARRIRYAFFQEKLAETGADMLCTAHQQTDNLEHLFIYLLRNSPAAFRGIPVSASRLFRPMMFAGADEIRHWLKESGQEWREDRSNAETYYLRNKVRHWLIPAIAEAFPEAVREFRDLSAEVEHFYRKHKNGLMAWALENGKESGGGRLFPQHTDTQRFRSYLNLLGMKAAQAEKLLRPARTGSRFHFGEYLAEVRNNGVWVGREPDAGFPPVTISGPDELPAMFSAGDYQFTLSMEDAQNVNEMAGDSWIFDADGVQFPLQIRSRQKGDRIRPFGMNGSKKISDLLTDARVSGTEKDLYPLLADEAGILGLTGIRRSARAPVTDLSKKVVCVKWSRTASRSES